MNKKNILSTSSSLVNNLNSLGIYNFLDVLSYLPYRYENNYPSNEKNIVDKQRIVLRGKIEGEIKLSKFKKITLSRFRFISRSQRLYQVEAYNRAYLNKIINYNDEYIIHGIYDKNKINLINIRKFNKDDYRALTPIYSLQNKIEQYVFINLIKKAFNNINNIDSIIPKGLINKYKLIEKRKALYKLHFPMSFNEVKYAMRTLKYEECLKFCLKTLLIREFNSSFNKKETEKIKFKDIDAFILSLPYKLTTSQQDALTEIIFDMNKEKAMYHLLQGDVGCGKTLVASLSMLANKYRHKQSAFLAPTDALARQHYSYLLSLFKDINISIGLLLGSTSKKERKEIKNKLINGEIDILVGTHALFSKDIIYKDLALCVIDEQHKFGVNQRMALVEKNENADLLLLTATPIPRTLSLSLYADLDVSTINEFPFKERKIETKICKSDDKIIDEIIKNSLEKNKRIYIVAPTIYDDGNEFQISVDELVSNYALKYNKKITYLHGKLSDEDKIKSLTLFKSGEKPILISTSVIEVGIDVKNADTMIIYGALHFGLASLHQLRGRIGRDGSFAKCILVYDGDDQDNIDKLNVLVESNDGFKISEEDLKRRGPGDLVGFKQAGLPNFNYVNIVKDFKMFESAREDAKKIILSRNLSQYHDLVNEIEKEINDISFTNV